MTITRIQWTPARIAALPDAARMYAWQVAEGVGTSKTQFSRWATGKTSPGPVMLARLDEFAAHNNITQEDLD